MVYQHLRSLWLPPPGSVLKAQSKLLNHFVKQPLITGSKVLNSVDTGSKRVGEANSQNSDSKGNTIVLAHGFGSGLGFFFRSYDELLKSPKVDRVVAFDWLGMGGSPRPNCCAAPRVPLVMRSRFNPTEASDFFVDSMEEWRRSMQLEKFTLVGHSLGGYLAARYVLKYPGRVQNLVLASPAGIPEPMVENLVVEPASGRLPIGIQAIQKLWSSNFTPQQIVRLLGPRGQQLMRNIVHRRFGGRWNEAELELVSDYLWTMTVAPASGEYALNSVLQLVADAQSRGVYARDPLAPMLPDIQVERLKILFGDNDWLHTQDANKTVRELENKVLASGNRVEFDVIESAGHHLYLDNTRQFHDAIFGVLS